MKKKEEGSILNKRYKIIRELGCGGFGITYLAHDEQLKDKEVVIKQIRNPEPDLVDRFEEEISALVNLGNHSQIPSITEQFQEDDEHYLVQDYVKGETLRSVLEDKKKINNKRVIKITKELLEILVYVHEKAIHRDIKPSNIIIREHDKKIVLIDFGIVKAINKKQENHQTIGIGTKGYTPKEQWDSKPEKSSDVYAVGMTAIESITGIYPTNITAEKKELNKIDTNLKVILLKMTEAESRNRYQSAEEALKALEAYEYTSEKTIRQKIKEKESVTEKINEIIYKGINIIIKIENPKLVLFSSILSIFCLTGVSGYLFGYPKIDFSNLITTGINGEEEKYNLCGLIRPVDAKCTE